MEKKRVLLVLLDGVSDAGTVTPLSSAKTPNLDFLMSRSNAGLLLPVGRNIAPESDAAMMSLLGNDPFKVYTGRGIIEAVGAGVRVHPSEVVFRTNIAYTNKSFRITKVQGTSLSKAEREKINRIDPNIRLVPTLEYRSVLILKGGRPEVTNSHPGYKQVAGNLSTALPIKGRALKRRSIRPLTEKAAKTASLLESWSGKAEKILKDRTILLRGGAVKPPMLKKLHGWACVADTPVEYGVAKLSGMALFKSKPTLSSEAKQVIALLKKHAGVYVQLKGPDHYGHLGDFKGKKRSIEEIDAEFFSVIKDGIDLKSTTLIVTGDHATPVSRMAHGPGPTPLMVSGSKKDKVKRFTESSCRKGCLGIIPAHNLLGKIEV